AADQTGVDGPCRHLVCRIPLGPVAHARDRQPVDRIALAISQDTIHLAVIVGTHPRTIVVLDFERSEDVAVARLGRRGEQRPRNPSPAGGGPNERPVEAARVINVRGTSRREVAWSAKYGPFSYWTPLTNSGIRKLRSE